MLQQRGEGRASSFLSPPGLLSRVVSNIERGKIGHGAKEGVSENENETETETQDDAGNH